MSTVSQVSIVGSVVQVLRPHCFLAGIVLSVSLLTCDFVCAVDSKVNASRRMSVKGKPTI